jgi:hypothetical protein
MKDLGWIFTIFGGAGLIVTLILRGGDDYKQATIVSGIGSFFGGGREVVSKASNYVTITDILFYVAIGMLLLGILLVIFGYLEDAKKINEELLRMKIRDTESKQDDNKGGHNFNTCLSNKASLSKEEYEKMKSIGLID